MAPHERFQGRSIVVTGASTGIGRACVASAIGGGAHVFATVRSQADAAGLSQEFSAAVTPLIMDVTDAAAVADAAAQVREALGGRALAGLVNNAGVVVAGPVELLPAEDLRRQFDINLFGVHEVTRAFLPLLKGEQPGRIVMISSIGAKDAQVFSAGYAASKAALEKYAQSLRREMMLYGIKVIIVAPGSVKTPIWDKAIKTDPARYAGTPYERAAERMRALIPRIEAMGLPAARIGETVWRMLTMAHPPQKVMRIAGLTGWAQLNLPPEWIDRAIANALELKPQSRPQR
ncbi:MAG: SDR family NAD(P)-dependent oxidoreductase [Hyphomonadaceae bacterium]|nr:SDR family NAD(P)-dependent oxidoreductase [Hyphomonadaceae bacterium]